MYGPVAVWLRDAYGGKNAFVRYWATRTKILYGGYRPLRDVDFLRVDRLVFVCKGNICRSPYAEARARGMGYKTISAGLDAAPGTAADPVATRVAMSRGVDLSKHLATHFDVLALQRGDLVIAFEPSHAAYLLKTRQRSPYQVTLVGLFAPFPFAYVHDPFGLAETYFSACFQRIDAALSVLSTRLPFGCRIA